jgi:hypothetical protein
MTTHDEQPFTPVPFDRVWPRKEAAKMLGVSVASVRKMQRLGILTPIWVTQRCIGYRDSQIRRLVHERTGQPPQKSGSNRDRRS